MDVITLLLCTVALLAVRIVFGLLCNNLCRSRYAKVRTMIVLGSGNTVYNAADVHPLAVVSLRHGLFSSPPCFTSDVAHPQEVIQQR